MLYCFKNSQDSSKLVLYRQVSLLFLGILFSSCPLFGGEGESLVTVSFPIAMRVDLDYYIETGLYLKCQGKKHDIQYNAVLQKDEEITTILKPLIRKLGTATY